MEAEMKKHPLELTDKELIDWLVGDALNNIPIGELTRRNTVAINKFNSQSSFLAWGMIVLALISITIAICK
jgi:hypothetical protein